jgi:hypothetical protein
MGKRFLDMQFARGWDAGAELRAAGVVTRKQL